MFRGFRLATRRMRFVYLSLIILGAGCASGGTAVPAEEPEMGLAQLLRLPVDNGHAGIEEVIRTVYALYGLSPPDKTTTPSDDTTVPVTLADGTVISEVDLSRTGSGIFIAVAEQPCFPIGRAVALTGALKMHDGPHGDAGYDAYSFRNPGVSISFSAGEPGRSCVGSLSISKIFSQETP